MAPFQLRVFYELAYSSSKGILQGVLKLILPGDFYVVKILTGISVQQNPQLLCLVTLGLLYYFVKEY